MLPQGKDNVERLVWAVQKGLDVRIWKNAYIKTKMWSLC